MIEIPPSSQAIADEERRRMTKRLLRHAHFALLHTLPVRELRAGGLRPWEKCDRDLLTLMLLPSSWAVGSSRIPGSFLVTGTDYRTEPWQDVRDLPPPPEWPSACDVLPYGILARPMGRPRLAASFLFAPKRSARLVQVPSESPGACVHCGRARDQHFVASHPFAPFRVVESKP